MPASNINDLVTLPAYEQANLVAWGDVSPVGICQNSGHDPKIDHELGTNY